jgi:hypothetical protein
LCKRKRRERKKKKKSKNGGDGGFGGGDRVLEANIAPLYTPTTALKERLKIPILNYLKDF